MTSQGRFCGSGFWLIQRPLGQHEFNSTFPRYHDAAKYRVADRNIGLYHESKWFEGGMARKKDPVLERISENM